MKRNNLSSSSLSSGDTPKRNSPSKKFRMGRLLLSFGLAFLLLCLVYRKMDFKILLESLKNGSVGWGIILFSIGIEAVANSVRGLRWRLQMLPLAPPVARRRIVIAAMWGCYAVNLALPRMGEVWRCYLVSQKERLSFSSVVGTLISDRLVDVVMMGFLFLIAIGGYYSEVIHLFAEAGIGQGLSRFFSSPWIYLAMLLLVLLVVVFRRQLKRSRWRDKVASFGRQFATGFRTIQKMPRKWLFILLTLLIYLLYFIAFYITFYAFPFTQGLGVGVGLLAFIMATLGVALPVQGGIGPWHFMCITTLVAFGVGDTEAGLFALVVHTSQTFGIALLGLLAILFVPLLSRNRSKNEK